MAHGAALLRLSLGGAGGPRACSSAFDFAWLWHGLYCRIRVDRNARSHAVFLGACGHRLPPAPGRPTAHDAQHLARARGGAASRRCWGAVPSGPAASCAAMAALRLPLAAAATPDHAAAVQRDLAEDHKIEVAAFAHRGALWLRVAAQAYNELADYDRLARIFPVTRSEAKG